MSKPLDMHMSTWHDKKVLSKCLSQALQTVIFKKSVVHDWFALNKFCGLCTLKQPEYKQTTNEFYYEYVDQYWSACMQDTNLN